ncbi:hypothetical protein DRH27_02405 [Candidatus Falkowbacteria bacterium]|nr:MAG: hypothetical protein DRH27_02405 [Candidatus Falkowbacteria bacterium]
MSDKKTILICEDEIPMLETLANKFRNEGFEVIEARNGEEGFKLALSKKPDLMLLDIVMPKLDGLSLMKKIRDNKWGSDVPIVLLTNLSDAEKVSEAAKYGVYDFLVKTDWRLDDIVALVREKLDLNF